jgi:hypothetical protein
MTNELVDKFKQLNEEKSNAVQMSNTLKQKIVDINLEMRVLQKECDHHFPDGSYAWRISQPFKVCSVCGEVR